ncbi:MAG: hypothetical protein WA089_21335, partial [Anaerolineae bacterium]
MMGGTAVGMRVTTGVGSRVGTGGMVDVGRRVGGGGSIHCVGTGVGVWIGDWKSDTIGPVVLLGIACGCATSVSGSGVTLGGHPGPQLANTTSRPANSSAPSAIVNLMCNPFM